MSSRNGLAKFAPVSGEKPRSRQGPPKPGTFIVTDAYGHSLSVMIDGHGQYQAVRCLRFVMRDERPGRSCTLLTRADLARLRDWIDVTLEARS